MFTYLLCRLSRTVGLSERLDLDWLRRHSDHFWHIRTSTGRNGESTNYPQKVTCPQRVDRHHVPPATLLPGLSDVEAFDQNSLGQWREQEHRDWGHHESMTWRARRAETILRIMQRQMRMRTAEMRMRTAEMRMRTAEMRMRTAEMRMRTADAMEVRSGLRLLDRAADHAYWSEQPWAVNELYPQWNSLPYDVHHSESTSSFKQALKTHLFKSAYN